jgi:uncharacterized protein YoxC
MPDGNTQKFELSLSELDKFLDLTEKAIDGISKAATLTKQQRKEMRQSVGDTCETIDSILTSVKQRISFVNKELQNDIPSAKTHISELANAQEWESKYRKFQLCEPLRTAAGELRDSVLGKFIRFFSFKNPDDLRNTIDTFLKGEEAAGEFVAKLLHNLSLLANQADSRKDFVLSELEKARQSVQEYRDKFIKLEKEIRATI